MNVVVVGSGLIGVTLAYYLRLRGHDVTVVERREGSAQETSFANGSLLTPSMSDPWNAPGSWRALLASLAGRHSGLMVRPHVLPAMAAWGITFLRNSRPARFSRAVESNVRLALLSLQTMHELRRVTGIEYARSARGALRIFREPGALERAHTLAASRAGQGLPFQRLSRAQLVQLESGLAPIADELCGAIHYLSDETGDAYAFCVALERCATALGVCFRFGTQVRSIEVRANRVVALDTSNGQLSADEFVIAAGCNSSRLLERIGVSLPVQPAKGYSITFDVPPASEVLRIPVIDDQLHAAVVPLAGAIRVAGTAEFAGCDLTLSQRRIDSLLQLLPKVLPRANLSSASGRPWCGLRPMSADGVPLIGATMLENLKVSTGHGHLGWTLAVGSAQLLAAMMSGESLPIDPTPYDPRRFP